MLKNLHERKNISILNDIMFLKVFFILNLRPSEHVYTCLKKIEIRQRLGQGRHYSLSPSFLHT